ncbi:DNA (cytosine-5-)-methyltransferase [Scytonema sp. UIC 10036]|uniref:DNA cytosine methyltransferase n=1 Tax=Scytonema sp. UIC 10036 TaxID=2304196 RepID=UPI0012DA23D7|nr:DNA cytosine methyltransferase [Scytonema sp. UIC 10036]MUG93375.1 DNA (cytosine-5-)-methyltransferase [Scytonema sp. UIC 10036]
MARDKHNMVENLRLQQNKSRTALSLFSGAGGLDLGLMQAGFDILACIEIDPHCCHTLRASANRDGRSTRVIEDDIRNVDPTQLMGELLLLPGKLDLLCGGSPCQSFSQIGKRGCLEDERGTLLFEFVRFAEVLQPKAILIEQVKGLLNAPDRNGKIGGVYEMLQMQLQELGYELKMKVIRAVEYGVAQMRERVFVVAMTKDGGFEFPPPTHSDPSKPTLSISPLPPYVSVGEVLRGLGEPISCRDNQLNDNHIDITPVGDRKRIHGVPEGSHLAKELHLPIEQRCKLTKKDTTKFRRLSRTEPSITLRCGEIFFHPTEDRYLTPREYMRIHGYPDTYLLKGPIRGRSGRVRYLDQHRQVANSVPPPIACAIGKAIQQALDASELQQKHLLNYSE